VQLPIKWARWTHADPGAAAAGWQPPRLCAIDARQARLARLCHGAVAARIGRALARQAPVLSACGVAAEPGDAGRALLRLAHPAGVAALLFDLADYPELALLVRQPEGAAQSVDAAGLARLAPLRRTVLAALAAPLLERLASIGLAGFDVLDLVPAQGATPPPRALGLRVAWGGVDQRRAARVWLPEALLDALLPALETRAAGPGLRLPALRVPGRLMLGARSFTEAGLRALEPGDVVLNVSSARPLAGDGDAAELALVPFSCHVAWGTAGLMCATARVRIAGRQLTLMESPMMTEESALQDGQSLPGHALGTLAADAELATLEIPISFEIDTLALPLDELAGLAPGYVLELAQRVEQVPLRLVAYGRTIGSGELVAVGERLGVRILSIAHHRAPALPAADAGLAEGLGAGVDHAAV